MNKICIGLTYGIFVSVLIYRVEVQYVKTEKNLCNQKGISALLNIQTVKDKKSSNIRQVAASSTY